MADRPRISREPLRPDRVRRIEGGFAFLPSRLLHDGFLEALDPEERDLYLFLVLAGDRNGVSYYSQDRIARILGRPLHEILQARNRLIRRDLLAFDGLRFQILHLPEAPVPLTQPRATPTNSGPSSAT